MFVKIQKPDRLCRHKNNKAIRLAEDFDSNGRLTALFKIALCVERCHAARSGRRDGLTIGLVLNVSSGKDAFHTRGGSRLRLRAGGDDIAAVKLELALEDRRVGLVADRERRRRRRLQAQVDLRYSQDAVP